MSMKNKLIHLLGGYTSAEYAAIKRDRDSALAKYDFSLRAIEEQAEEIAKLKRKLEEQNAVTEIVLNKGGVIRMLDADGNPIPFTFDLNGGELKEE